MSKKDYSIKFYKATMENENNEIYYFYFAERSYENAYRFLRSYINDHRERYHIFPGENDIKDINVNEVPIEKYGIEPTFEVLN